MTETEIAAVAAANPDRVVMAWTRYTLTIEDFIVLPEGYTSSDVERAWHDEGEESTFVKMKDGTCFKVPSDHTKALAMQDGFYEEGTVALDPVTARTAVRSIAEHRPDLLIEAEVYDGN